MPRFFVCYAVQKAAAARRKRPRLRAFCRHSIQHEGAPAPSYSPCCIESFFYLAEVFRQAENSRAMHGSSKYQKASQSFAPTGAKAVKSVFCRDMCVAEHSLRGAFVELAASQPTEAQSASKPLRTSGKATCSKSTYVRTIFHAHQTSSSAMTVLTATAYF